MFSYSSIIQFNKCPFLLTFLGFSSNQFSGGKHIASQNKAPLFAALKKYI